MLGIALCDRGLQTAGDDRVVEGNGLERPSACRHWDGQGIVRAGRLAPTVFKTTAEEAPQSG
ncbi:MAG: hypothetical protein WBP03_02165 [Candidatus Saccharimonadales bacterium]